MSTQIRQTQDNRNDPVTIDTLIGKLADPNGLKRQEARLKLVEIGKAAVPALVEKLADRREQVRWEAAKALSQIGDPTAAPALVKALEDENSSVRWLAAEGLIAARREGLPPLLQALVHHSDSVWLREGAHHVLRSLVGEPGLHPLIASLMTALGDVEPVIEVPSAAEEVLEALADRTHRVPRY